MTLNIGCALIFIGVRIEKGMGLVTPGLAPDVPGEIYDYSPTGIELLLSLGIRPASRPGISESPVQAA